MGYETNLIIGTVTEFGSTRRTEGACLILDVCQVDLSKAGYSTATGRLLQEVRETATEHYCYFAEDGDTIITKDLYDERLSAVPLPALIAALESDQAEEPYRRFSLALAVLREFATNPQWQADRLLVIQVGH